MDADLPPSPGIGSLNETSLHADLKRWYARPGDRLETRVDGYVVDIVRDDLLIEIQTRNFNALKRKLLSLTANHPVRLIHPIPLEKWIVRLAADGETHLSRRKSPRRGRLEQVFAELVRIPGLSAHPNFTLEVVLIQVEEIQLDDGLLPDPHGRPGPGRPAQPFQPVWNRPRGRSLNRPPPTNRRPPHQTT